MNEAIKIVSKLLDGQVFANAFFGLFLTLQDHLSFMHKDITISNKYLIKQNISSKVTVNGKSNVFYLPY